MGLNLARVPRRCSGEVKEGLLKLIDQATEAGWPHARACRALGVSDVRAHRWRARRRAVGTLTDLTPGGNPVHRILDWERQAVLDLVEEWGPVDRTHRKLAHRGSYLGEVFVSPSTLLRITDDAGVTLPGERVRPSRPAPVLPEIPWEPNRIWIWDATHFTRCDRSVYAIVDVVSRFWIETLVTTEQTTTQVQLLFTTALESQGLLDAEGRPIRRPHGGTGDGEGPVLVAWSDNGPEMKAGDTRTFMALMAITQHHGRPHTPTDQAPIESFFGHLKGEWPHLTTITDPAVLDVELGRVRVEYNTVRLHEGIGYVTPDDEHSGRGSAIRRRRSTGMKNARRDRIDYNRNNPPQPRP
ncbi:MAG: integrase core domain-containing protein [Acidimicrobiia bacterium]